MQGTGEAAIFSSSAWGQGRDQELGAEGGGRNTNPKGGEVFFHIPQRTNWVALDNSLLVGFFWCNSLEIGAENKTECEDT